MPRVSSHMFTNAPAKLPPPTHVHAQVRAIQGKGLVACVTHYIGTEQVLLLVVVVVVVVVLLRMRLLLLRLLLSLLLLLLLLGLLLSWV